MIFILVLMSRDEGNSVVFTQIGNFTNATFLCWVTAIYGASSKLATILKLALTMASWLIEKTLTYYLHLYFSCFPFWVDRHHTFYFVSMKRVAMGKYLKLFWLLCTHVAKSNCHTCLKVLTIKISIKYPVELLQGWWIKIIVQK